MKDIKNKLKQYIPILIIFVCSINFISSSYNIIKWKIDSTKTKKLIKEINDIITIEEVFEKDLTDEKNDDEVEEDTDNEITQNPIIVPEENESHKIEIIDQPINIPDENPYWDYIKMSLINVNFDQLKAINPDTKGWIIVNGTNINYPFVQAIDNKFYLTHSFDKSYNNAGWVFLDFRNNIENLSKNTILYAHGRVDTTMFGSLKNILKSGWLNNTNNYIVKISTEYENSLWQVFSIYHIPTTNDYIQVDFSNDEEFVNWANMLINRSFHNFNTSVHENDKVLTLSTCFNDKEKVVLHAKLIKKEEK